MLTDIQSPEIAYGPVIPLLIVFGAAVLGVLIEAFAPAASRRSLQIGLAAVALLGAVVSVISLAGTHELVFSDAIAVDGVSLTVSAVGDDWFEVSLIPETLSATTLGSLQPGDRVNIETDILARHVLRMNEVSMRPAAYSTTEGAHA